MDTSVYVHVIQIPSYSTQITNSQRTNSHIIDITEWN